MPLSGSMVHIGGAMHEVRSVNFVIGTPVERIPHRGLGEGYDEFFKLVDELTDGKWLDIQFPEVSQAINFRQRLQYLPQYESCRTKNKVYARKAGSGTPDPYLETRSRAGKLGGAALARKVKKEKKIKGGAE